MQTISVVVVVVVGFTTTKRGRSVGRRCYSKQSIESSFPALFSPQPRADRPVHMPIGEVVRGVPQQLIILPLSVVGVRELLGCIWI